ARVPALAEPLGGMAGIALALLGVVGVVAWSIATRSQRVRFGLLLAATCTCAGTLLAPDALATPWLRTPWALIILIGCGALALAAWQRGRMLLRIPKILADLRAGVLDVFEGPGVPGNHALRDVLGRVAPNRNVRLEVLPRAQLVVGVDDAWTASWQLAHVAEIAATQPHAYRTALPAGVVAVVPDARIELRRRSLTPDERAEISDHVRRLRRAAWPALAATVAVVVVLGMRMSMTADWHNLVDAVALGWYTLAAIAYFGYARRIAAARKLESDRDLRWVVTVEDPQRAPERNDAPRLEVLPVSHLAWTENASPAAWRLCRL
ncbi:MAG: hypothetical protein IAG13_34200, partial [Deltaproteobacteria bacterium]|nr:hypothetical protein [Nannocystaceae bacterium]